MTRHPAIRAAIAKQEKPDLCHIHDEKDPDCFLCYPEIPEKEVFHLSNEGADHLTQEDIDDMYRDAERPEEIITTFEAVRAYQHFLYNFNQNHFEANSPFSEHMTKHFIAKLAGFRQRNNPEFCNSVSVLASWVQEMTASNQELLLHYIISNHLNKW